VIGILQDLMSLIIIQDTKCITSKRNKLIWKGIATYLEVAKLGKVAVSINQVHTLPAAIQKQKTRKKLYSILILTTEW